MEELNSRRCCSTHSKFKLAVKILTSIPTQRVPLWSPLHRWGDWGTEVMWHLIPRDVTLPSCHGRQRFTCKSVGRPWGYVNQCRVQASRKASLHSLENTGCWCFPGQTDVLSVTGLEERGWEGNGKPWQGRVWGTKSVSCLWKQCFQSVSKPFKWSYVLTH